jgi:AbrB family looped-hinge helix DNA binding protein
MATFVAIQKRGTISLPADVRAQLGLDEPGSQLELTVRDGEIILRPYVAVPADQAWFLSAEWKLKVGEAEEHVRSGNETEFANVDEFVAFLDTMIKE